MAELDARFIQNLNDSFKEMNQLLIQGKNDANDFWKKIKETPKKELDAFVEEVRKIDKKKVAELSVALNFTDEKGNPLNVEIIKSKAENLAKALDNGRKTYMMGRTHFTSRQQMVDQLSEWNSLINFSNKPSLEQAKVWANALDVVNKERERIAENERKDQEQKEKAKQREIEKNDKILEQLIKQEEKEREIAEQRKKNTDDKQYKEDQKYYDKRAELQRKLEHSAGEMKYKQMSRDVVEYTKAVQRMVDLETKANQIRKDYNRIKGEISGLDKSSVQYQKGQQILAQYRNELHNVYQEQKKIDKEYGGTRSAAYSQQRLEGLKQEYEQLKRNEGQIKKNKAGLDSMIPTLQRLGSAFGLAFSVQGLVNFGKKLIETRGEFEMQFVAMKQIIGDVDAATKIWNQTMQQALQSPFKAMQLVDYTKKLAAYRVETEKLFDTTKRLADVSAGLGVDMGRLILAYGQVKAANFLRASEIRQFTEAGVNIVGQLSEYFTQLEGRAVSTADVMERVTKRMVMFSDVEEIFKRMTDEGGEFYKMQEVQADTVRGQIMKLHDAYDQMLNTIGQANQGTIRDLVEAMNNLVRNWRDVAHFLELSGIGLLIWRARVLLTSKDTKIYAASVDAASKSLVWWNKTLKAQNLTFSQYITHLKKAEASAAGFDKVLFRIRLGAVKLNAALKAIPSGIWWFAIIEGLSLIMTKIGEADRAAKQLTKDFDEVGKRNAQSLQDNIDGFTKLVERLKKATEGSQDYLDIRNKIQNQYGEYLDNLEAEQITVENLANSYDRVVERMREKSRQHIMEEGLQEITNTYGEVYTRFVKNLEGKKYGGKIVNLEEAENVAKLMYEMYVKNPQRYSGGIDEKENYSVLFANAMRKYGFKISAGTSRSTGKYMLGLGQGVDDLDDFYKAIQQRQEKQIELETKANSITKAQASSHQEYLDQLALQEEHEREIERIESKTALSVEKRNYLIQKEDLRYQEKKLELLAKYGKKSDEWLDNEKEKLKDNLKAFLNSYNTRVEAYVGSVYGSDWREKDNVDAFKDYEAMIATQSRIAQGQSRWEEAILNDKKTTEDNIKRLKEQQATQTARDAAATAQLNEELAKENHRLAIIKKQMELLGLHEKDKSTGGGSANNSIYEDRIRLLQDMLQKYRQAAKEAYGFAKAEEKTGQSFEDAWKSIMPAGYGELEVPTSYSGLAEMLQRLEAFTPQFDKNGQLSKMMADLKKAIADALSNVDIEMSVRIREDFGRQMEEAFGNYELTLELQKLNLPSDVMSDLFDLETVDLSDLRRKVVEFYNERLAVEADPTDLIKQVEDYYKKIDDMERKQQRDRIKDYAKYLEYELSERAKIEMEYTRKSADVAADQAFTSEQKEQIQKRLKEERDKAIAKQEWEDFKGSETYIQMMEDLEHQGTNALIAMRTELERIRENAENLSPRALKEVVNALEKIDEITIRRGMPISNIRNAAAGVRSARVEALESGLSWEQVSSRKAAKQTQADIKAQLLPMEQQFNILQSQLGAEKEIARLEHERYENGLKLNEVFGETFMTGDNEYLQELITNSITNIESSQERINELTEQRKNASEADTKAIDQKLAEEEANLACLEAERDLLEKQLELNIAIAKEALNRAATPEERASLQARINELEEKLKKLRGQDAAVENLTKEYGLLDKASYDAMTKLSGWGQQAVEVFGSFKEMMTSLGVDTDTDAWDDMTTAFETLGTVASTAGSIATKLAAGDVPGAIMEGVKGIMNIVSQWAGNHDASLERQIKKQQERIDDLKDAYARLEKQIERTWSSVSYMQIYEQQVQNIREQIAAMEAQRRAEEAKKNTDNNAVRQYKRDIQDAYDQLEELEQKSIEVFGGIGEEGYRSAAQGFVEAWKEAFLETGDGLQGLKDHFDEFLEDWFVKQATMRVAGKMLESVFRQIDAAVDKYGEGGTAAMLSEIERIHDMVAAIFPALSLALEDLSGMFGVGGEGSLSGLAAGIQGMTEEQANILEAYWNSVRMYTANIDINVERIANILGAGGDNANPMLGKLDSIINNTAYIKRIYDMLEPMQTNNGSGRGFRTYNL